MLAGLAVALLTGTALTRTGSSIEQLPAPALSARQKLQARYFPNFELTTNESKKVHFYDDLIKDKIVGTNIWVSNGGSNSVSCLSL